MGALTALVVVASQQYRRCCIPSLRKIRSWHAGQYRSQLDGHIEIDNSSYDREYVLPIARPPSNIGEARGLKWILDSSIESVTFP